jgi:hypothetical protein
MFREDEKKKAMHMKRQSMNEGEIIRKIKAKIRGSWRYVKGEMGLMSLAQFMHLAPIHTSGIFSPDIAPWNYVRPCMPLYMPHPGFARLRRHHGPWQCRLGWS